MKKLFKSTLVLLALATFAWVGCKKDDHDHEHGHDEITQITLTFTPRDAAQGGSVVFQFTDPDGLGPKEPIKTEPTLRSNTSYNVTIALSSGSKDVTNEVKESADTHQFFFIRVPNTLMSHSYQDADRNGKPIGLVNNFQTGGAGRGVLTVVLRHELNKLMSGLNELNYPTAGGSTDIEASFNVVIVN